MEIQITLGVSVRPVRDVSPRLQAGRTNIDPLSGTIIRSIASALQKWEKPTGLLETPQKPPEGWLDLTTAFRRERNSFSNTCERLLSGEAKSGQYVEDIVKNKDHPFWTDLMAHRGLEVHLERFYDLCLLLIEHLCKILDQFQLGLESQDRRLFRKVLLRIKSSASGMAVNLSDLIQKLKDDNDVFRTLVQQATLRGPKPFAGSSSFDAPIYQRSISGSEMAYSHFGCIQRASQTLYEALSHAWSCHEREAHDFSIYFQCELSQVDSITPHEGTCFDIAVTSSHFDGPYRMLVKLVKGEICTCQSFMRKLGRENEISDEMTKRDSLAYSGILAPPENDKNQSPCHARSRVKSGSIAPESFPNFGRDLSSKDNLCYYLRESYRNTRSKQVAEYYCLGFLTALNGVKFLLYHNLGDQYQGQARLSLHDILNSARHEDRGLSVEARLRVASFIAKGLLFLRTTKWLPYGWGSKDIYFLNNAQLDSEELLADPFFQIRLDNDFARPLDHEAKTSLSDCSDLLSLGLILIELAFSSPWPSLQLRDDIRWDLSVPERNFLDLMRLSDTVSREFGSRYGAVVRTCIDEGFSRHESLDLKADLDVVLYDAILKELQKCMAVMLDDVGMSVIIIW